MWSLIIFKYMLYRLNMNRYVYKQIKLLLKGKKIWINKKSFLIKKKRKKKKIKSNKSISYDKANTFLTKSLKINTFFSSIDDSFSSLKCSYFKVLIKSFLMNYIIVYKDINKFNWLHFLESIYNEFYIFDLLFKKETNYFNFFKNMSSIDYLSNVTNTFCDYHNYVLCDDTLDNISYYLDDMSYQLPDIDIHQRHYWPSYWFSSFKEYQTHFFYLKLFLLFFCKLFYLKNQLIINQNKYLNRFMLLKQKSSLFSFYVNPKCYLLNSSDFFLYDSVNPFFYLNNRITFNGVLEYQTDVINIMFFDLLFLDFPRIWFSSYYTFFLKCYINYKQFNFQYYLFYLLSVFYDIEYTQLWLYKMYEDKAFAFYGYGGIFAKYKFKTKLEIIESPSFNSLDYYWASNYDLSDLIVIKQSPFLTFNYLYIRNKKSFYNY